MADKMLMKNVTISDAHLRLPGQLLKKHQGNLSAAMRDIIYFTGFITENTGSLKRAKDHLKDKNHANLQTCTRYYDPTDNVPVAGQEEAAKTAIWHFKKRECSLSDIIF